MATFPDLKALYIPSPPPEQGLSITTEPPLPNTLQPTPSWAVQDSPCSCVWQVTLPLPHSAVHCAAKAGTGVIKTQIVVAISPKTTENADAVIVFLIGLAPWNYP
jgi:hypothetical protein